MASVQSLINQIVANITDNNTRDITPAKLRNILSDIVNSFLNTTDNQISSANVANSIVKRDNNGDFSARIITASLSGAASSVSNTVTFNNSGTGDASGTTFNGSAARTISYNSIGALGANQNAVSASKLQTARNINGVAFDGTANISINTNNAVTFNNSGTGDASGSTFNGSAARTISYNTIGALGANQNAVSASKLQTARNINGVAFDGTANISINTNNAVTFNNSGTGDASGSTFNGSAARTISYNSIGALPSTIRKGGGTYTPTSIGNTNVKVINSFDVQYTVFDNICFLIGTFNMQAINANQECVVYLTLPSEMDHYLEVPSDAIGTIRSGNTIHGIIQAKSSSKQIKCIMTPPTTSIYGYQFFSIVRYLNN